MSDGSERPPESGEGTGPKGQTASRQGARPEPIVWHSARPERAFRIWRLLGVILLVLAFLAGSAALVDILVLWDLEALLGDLGLR